LRWCGLLSWSYWLCRSDWLGRRHDLRLSSLLYDSIGLNRGGLLCRSDWLDRRHGLRLSSLLYDSIGLDWSNCGSDKLDTTIIGVSRPL